MTDTPNTCNTCHHYRDIGGPAFHGRCCWPSNIVAAVPDWVRKDAIGPLVIADTPTRCAAWAARSPVERPEPLALRMRRLDYENADMSALSAFLEGARP